MILIDQDKANHFVYGALIAATSFPLVGWWAAVPCALIAFGKEGYDYLHRDKHTPDLMDTAWTLAGSSAVLLSHLKELL